MYTEIKACRVCGNTNLESILDLGEQALTGVFPRKASDTLARGPLSLVKCVGDNVCGLVQLRHSYTQADMYGENYGYRSGLNALMVAHLKSKVDRIKGFDILQPYDLVLDIGSNDGTTLALYEREDLTLVGIDPTSAKFRKYYKPHITAIADFFNAATFKSHFGERKAKVVTSFSMFYDLEDPIAFVREISEVLDAQGIWVLEQSYMPLMLDTNSYDTVCHEHLEYYALAQIDWIVRQCEMEIVDVEINEINGGSFSLTVQKTGGQLGVRENVEDMRAREAELELDNLATYKAFEERVITARQDFVAFVEQARGEGKSVVALGASTKGNVVLQYCNFTEDHISAVGEVNPDKFGTVTPGTHLPIRDEAEVLEGNPDYVVVLPWHFRKFFDTEERYAHLNLVYPLPKLEIRPGK